MKRKEVSEPERLSRFATSFGSNHYEDFKCLILKMISKGQSLE